MKYKALFGAVIFSLGAYAEAGCVGTVVNGRCIGTYIDNPNIGSDSDSDSGSKSSSGTRYQYDLSDPSDSLRYSTDLDAQRRDQMSLDPNRSLDQGTGQFGGGIYGN